MGHWLFVGPISSLIYSLGDSGSNHSLTWASEAVLWSFLDSVCVFVMLLIPFAIVFKVIRSLSGVM